MSQVFDASSPGRLDVMGGFSDYSGGLVLQMPIANTTTVQITLRNDFQCTVHSEIDDRESLAIEFNVKALIETANFSLDQIHDFFAHHEMNWAAYVAGCALLLHQQKIIVFSGADFRVQSRVPLGKGVSSSAALEVATMKALAKAFNLKFRGTELPVLAQKVENKIVGAPCGLMDQLASFHGIANHLLPILCQPDILFDPISIPTEIKFIGIDSGVRHSVSGASYTDVRCAAFMGYSIIAQSLGVSSREIQNVRESGNWTTLPYQGYLSNIFPAEFDQKFRDILPSKLTGKQFIDQYQTITDSISYIQPEKTYSIFNCASHPILENDRVKKVKLILEDFNTTGVKVSGLKKLSQLMHDAHDGYSLCGLNSDRTDEIVALAKQEEGIYGAKITGGGSGGTVCLLAHDTSGQLAAKKIHRLMEVKYQTKLALFE